MSLTNHFLCFVDYTKAFDSVDHQQLWTVLREMGFPKRIVSLIEALYSEQQSAVRTDSGTTYWFSKGVRQGCILSSKLFNAYTESIMREVEKWKKYRATVNTMNYRLEEPKLLN